MFKVSKRGVFEPKNATTTTKIKNKITKSVD